MNKEETKDEGKTPPTSSSWYQLANYKDYFDLSSGVAMRRIMKAIWPFTGKSFVETEEKADLYVPIWTYFTLVITMSSFGSLVSSMKEAEATDATRLNLNFDLDKLKSCFIVFTFFFFVNPFFFCIFFKCKGSEIGLAQLMCMVGYSFIPFVPVSFLFVLPYVIFRVVLLIGAACIAIYFLYKNMGKLCEKYLKDYVYFVRAYMITIQVILIVVIYFSFFS